MPTASHKFTEVQETPVAALSEAPAGAGRVCVLQAVPFHFSASGLVPDLVAFVPTASQKLAETHDTAASAPGPAIHPTRDGTGFRLPEPAIRPGARNSS
jgi:hypothetical protein